MVAVCTPGVVSSEKEQETGTLRDTSEMTLSSAEEVAETSETKERVVILTKNNDNLKTQE